jgi:hypothetical protein
MDHHDQQPQGQVLDLSVVSSRWLSGTQNASASPPPWAVWLADSLASPYSRDRLVRDKLHTSRFDMTEVEMFTLDTMPFGCRFYRKALAYTATVEYRTTRRSPCEPPRRKTDDVKQSEQRREKG